MFPDCFCGQMFLKHHHPYLIRFVSKIEDYHVRYLVDNADYVLCHTQADSGMSLKGIALAKERNKTIVEWK